MKTYEEMTESIIQKTEQRKKSLERKKRRLSLIAAVAAALILFGSITVGAALIVGRANRPAEMPDTESDRLTDTASAVPVQPDNTEYFRNMTALGEIPESGHGMSIVTGYAMLYIEDAYDAAKKADGGYLHYMYVQCTADFTAEYDNYQIDLIITDGNEEVARLTYNNEESAFDPLVAYNLDLFIPDGLEYCEVYLYFNLLDHETASIENYAADPYCKACAAFAKKYGYIITSYGVDKPETDRATLMTHIENDLHDYIFKSINRLYWYNDIGLNFIRSVDGQQAYENALKNKEFIEDNLISFRKDRKEDYDIIIHEWIGYKMKRNSQITDPGYYHDPLEYIYENRETVHLDDEIDTGPYVSRPLLITLT